jgi:hypothetical protein
VIAETAEPHTTNSIYATVYATTVVDVFMPKFIYVESTNLHSPFLRIENA